MKENSSNAVFDNLYDFYSENKSWIHEYLDMATIFNTDMVERTVSLYDLDTILENCTVLILTANSVEQNILTHKLYEEINANPANASKKKLREIYADNCVYQIAEDIKVVHIHPNSASSFTVDGSANAVRSALERFRPKIVISLGVAFGIDPDHQHLGDVLISNAIIPYDVFNKDTDGNIKIRSQDKYSTHEAINAWNVLMRSKKFYLGSQDPPRKNLIGNDLCFQWQFGTMLSGGSVLSNEDKKQALLKAAKNSGDDDIIGGEMEGTGVYFECHKPGIPCVVIKGICDWAAEKNSWDKIVRIENKSDSLLPSGTHLNNDSIKDCVQAYAADNAIEALLRLLRFDSIFLDTYSSAPRRSLPYKLRRNLSQAKQFFMLKKENPFLMVNIFIFVFLFIMLNIYINSNNSKSIAVEQLWLIYGTVSLLLIFAFQAVLKLSPIEFHHKWVNFSFDELNFKEKNAQITVNDRRQLSDISISWWLYPGKIILDNQALIELPTKDNKQKLTFRTLNEFNHKTILQIEYGLANGNRYIHLISRKNKKNKLMVVYCERVFQAEDSMVSLIGVKNAVIKKSLLNPR